MFVAQQIHKKLQCYGFIPFLTKYANVILIDSNLKSLKKYTLISMFWGQVERERQREREREGERKRERERERERERGERVREEL